MKFGAAVGPRRAGLGPDMPDPEILARRGERPGRVARAVAGHHPAAPRRPQRSAGTLRHPMAPCLQLPVGEASRRRRCARRRPRRRARSQAPCGATGPDAGDAAMRAPIRRWRRKGTSARRHALAWACAAGAASGSGPRSRPGRSPGSARPTWTRPWPRRRTTRRPRRGSSARQAPAAPSLPGAAAPVGHSCASSSGFP